MSPAYRLVHDTGAEKSIRVDVIHEGPCLFITRDPEETHSIRGQCQRFPRGRECGGVILAARL